MTCSGYAYNSANVLIYDEQAYNNFLHSVKDQKKKIQKQQKKEQNKTEARTSIIVSDAYLNGKQQHFINIPDLRCAQQQHSQFDTINFGGDQ